jgi:hypothetical protein
MERIDGMIHLVEDDTHVRETLVADANRLGLQRKLFPRRFCPVPGGEYELCR